MDFVEFLKDFQIDFIVQNTPLGTLAMIHMDYVDTFSSMKDNLWTLCNKNGLHRNSKDFNGLDRMR
jgi:hypothetical protein